MGEKRRGDGIREEVGRGEGIRGGEEKKAEKGENKGTLQGKAKLHSGHSGTHFHLATDNKMLHKQENGCFYGPI